MFRGLRVAIVAPPYYEVPPRGYGGIELVCALLADGLVARGHHVTVIGAGPDRIQADFVATFPEATTEELPDYMRVEIVHAARASRIVSGLDLDIVHDHTRLGALMAMARSLPTVLTVHAALAGPDSSADELEAVAPWMHPVAISEAQRHDGPQVPWAATVHNGIDTNRYPFRADKEDFVLYLGRVSEHKGVHFAIDAARAAGVKLRIAGSWTNGDERSYFEEQIRPRLDDDVSWHGEVQFEQKLDLLSRARCLLLPAQWREPFGLVIVEAMACGTPVVALRAGALPELVAEGRTGMLCDQPAELSDALQRIHEFEPAACRAHAVEHFDVARMVSRYEALYAQVLQLR